MEHSKNVNHRLSWLYQENPTEAGPHSGRVYSRISSAKSSLIRASSPRPTTAPEYRPSTKGSIPRSTVTSPTWERAPSSPGGRNPSPSVAASTFSVTREHDSISATAVTRVAEEKVLAPSLEFVRAKSELQSPGGNQGTIARESVASQHTVSSEKINKTLSNSSKGVERKESEPKDSEPKDSEPKDSEQKDAEKKDAEKKDTEKKDSEEEVTGEKSPDGKSFDQKKPDKKAADLKTIFSKKPKGSEKDAEQNEQLQDFEKKDSEEKNPNQKATDKKKPDKKTNALGPSLSESRVVKGGKPSKDEGKSPEEHERAKASPEFDIFDWNKFSETQQLLSEHATHIELDKLLEEEDVYRRDYEAKNVTESDDKDGSGGAEEETKDLVRIVRRQSIWPPRVILHRRVDFRLRVELQALQENAQHSDTWRKKRIEEDTRAGGGSRALMRRMKGEQLLTACRDKDIKAVLSLLKDGAPGDMQDAAGMGSAHYAAWAGATEILRALLAKGVNPNAKGFEGRAPLHFAAIFDCEPCVQTLLAAGADIAQRDRYAWTPLHYAAASDSPNAMRALLKAGADASVRDNQGFTPIEVSASVEVRDLLVAALRSASRKSSSYGRSSGSVRRKSCDAATAQRRNSQSPKPPPAS